VAGAIIALVAANIYLYIQIDHLRTDMAKLDESVRTGLTTLRDASSVTTAAQQRHLETLKEELEGARTSLHDQARTMSAQAKAEATARAEQLARQIEAEQAKVQQQVSSEISDVKQSATAANTRIADVTTDVGNVKTQVSATQAELQKTIADLKSVTGDLGVQSGLVATNGKELAALKRLGERNYIDINLGKTGNKRQRFGDISLLLKSVDAKKNRYSVEVMADDKPTLKENKSINEPVQFYTSKGGRLPYELVINEIKKKDKNNKTESIVGYLSTPKETVAR
jgi:hypothetical protein